MFLANIFKTQKKLFSVIQETTAKVYSVEQAEVILDKMPFEESQINRRDPLPKFDIDVDSINKVLNEYKLQKTPAKIFKAFLKMDLCRMKPDKISYNILIESLIECNKLEQAYNVILRVLATKTEYSIVFFFNFSREQCACSFRNATL